MHVSIANYETKWIKHTFVQASGWSFKVVKTSWAIFCWSPEPEYKVPTTLSRSPMSNFWLKSKSWLTVSWANTVAMMLLSFKHWKSWKKLRFDEIFVRFFVMFVTLARRQKFIVRNRCKPDYASFFVTYFVHLLAVNFYQKPPYLFQKPFIFSHDLIILV